jgi:L-amino acid N-acyltransferase YncA
MGDFKIRLAREADAPAILEIYAPVVQESPTSFEYEIPSLDEIKSRIRETMKRFPWLVATHADRVVGYAYASEHRVRKAYQWAVEASVYIHPDFYRQGIGKKLYLDLFERLRKQNFEQVIIGITFPNEASVKLHEVMGFKKIGVYPAIGFKFEKWHDVGWWYLPLNPNLENPRPIKPPATE